MSACCTCIKAGVSDWYDSSVGKGTATDFCRSGRQARTVKRMAYSMPCVGSEGYEQLGEVVMDDYHICVLLQEHAVDINVLSDLSDTARSLC